MTSNQENKFGMFLKVLSFYNSNSAVFNPIAHFPPLIAAIEDHIDAITEEAGDIGMDMSGHTVQKSETRTGLEEICLKVGAAVHLYGVNNSQPYIIEEDDYFKGTLANAPDCELLVLALQLHGIAKAIENDLGPYSSGPADVLLLNNQAQSFLGQIKVTRNNRRSRSRSVKKLKELYREMDELMKKSDIFLAVYYSVNRNLFSQYQSARKIDKLAGGKNVHKKQGHVLPAAVAYAPFSTEVLKAVSKMVFTNENKAGELQFYFSAKSNALPLPETKITAVSPVKPVKIVAKEAGFTERTACLNIRNPHVKRGTWKAEIKKD